MFRTGVSYVRLDVQVEDGKRVVTDLTKDDFVVYDEDVPREITYFGREKEPLSLILLLDVSGSMRKFLEAMTATANDALRHLNPGDRVAISLFSLKTHLFQDFTDNHGEVARQLKPAINNHTDLGSGTAINAAVIDAADYMHQKAPADTFGRRAILIVTDNLALNYQLPDEEVLRKLMGTDTVLNAIVVGKAKRPERPAAGKYVNPDFSPADVFKLAEESGGDAVKADQAARSFAEMLERIRSRYLLMFMATEAKPGSFRRVKVRLTPEARQRYPRAVIKYRAGYYVGE